MVLGKTKAFVSMLLQRFIQDVLGLWLVPLAEFQQFGFEHVLRKGDLISFQPGLDISFSGRLGRAFVLLGVVVSCIIHDHDRIWW